MSGCPPWRPDQALTFPRVGAPTPRHGALSVPAHRLSGWRDRVLLAGESVLKERERDARDDEIARLQAKVGEITMANELLYAKIDKLEAGRPLARGRSRR